MRCVLEAINLFPLQLQIAVDLVIIHHSTFFQEVTVCVERFNGFTQRPANLERLSVLLAEVRKVFVHRIAWIDFVLNAI